MQNLDRDICKWCRPRSDSAERSVQSRSAYLLKLQEVKGYMKQTILSLFKKLFSQQFTQPTLRDKRRTSTISTLIFFIFFHSRLSSRVAQIMRMHSISSFIRITVNSIQKKRDNSNINNSNDSIIQSDFKVRTKTAVYIVNPVYHGFFELVLRCLGNDFDGS